MEELLKTFFRFDFTNTKEEKEWLERWNFHSKKIVDSILEEENYSIEKILHRIFAELYGNEIIKSEMPWRDILAQGLEVCFDEKEYHLHHSLFDAVGLRENIVANKINLIRGNSQNYTYNYDTFQMELSTETEKQIDFIKKEEVPELAIEKFKNKGLKILKASLNEYYNNLYKLFIHDYSFWFLDIHFMLEIILKSCTKETICFDYINNLQAFPYYKDGVVLSETYRTYKKKMSGILLYDKIISEMNVKVKDGRDIITVTNFCPELMIYIFFEVSIQQFFKTNKDSFKRPFSLRTLKENIDKAGILMENSRDKEISYYIYEALFGPNICLCLTYYEKELRKRRLFDQIENEFDKIATKIFRFPNICLRTMILQEVLEPLLLVSEDSADQIMEKFKKANFILQKLYLASCMSIRACLTAFLVIISEKQIHKKLNINEEINNCELLETFDNFMSGNPRVKKWEKLIFRKEEYYDGYILETEDEIYLKYQKRYSSATKKRLS